MWRCYMRPRSVSRKAALYIRTAITQAWRGLVRLQLLSQKRLIRLVFPIIALVASIILLSPLLLPQGLPFQGDETYYIPWTLATLSRYNLQIWTAGNGPTGGILSLIPTLLLVGLRGILGQELGVKGYLLLMAWLTSMIPSVATPQLLAHWSLLVNPLKLELASGASCLLCLLLLSFQATIISPNS